MGRILIIEVDPEVNEVNELHTRFTRDELKEHLFKKWLGKKSKESKFVVSELNDKFYQYDASGEITFYPDGNKPELKWPPEAEDKNKDDMIDINNRIVEDKKDGE